MSNLLKTISIIPSPIGSPTPIPDLADLQNRLNLAEAAAIEAQAEHEQAAWAAECNSDPEYRDTADRLQAALRTAQSRVTNLLAALELARKRDAADLAEKRREMQRIVVANVSKMVRRRPALVERISLSIASLAKDFEKLQELGSSVSVAWPGGTAPPLGTLLTASELFHALEHEMYRISGRYVSTGTGATTGILSLPGARSPDLRLSGDPSAIPSMSSLVAAADDYLISVLEAAK